MTWTMWYDMSYDIWHMTYDIWHMTYDEVWRMTHDIQNASYDLWAMMNCELRAVIWAVSHELRMNYELYLSLSLYIYIYIYIYINFENVKNGSGSACETSAKLLSDPLCAFFSALSSGDAVGKGNFLILPFPTGVCFASTCHYHNFPTHPHYGPGMAYFPGRYT